MSTYRTGPGEPSERNPLVLRRELICERCSVVVGEVLSASGHVRLPADRVSALWPDVGAEVERHERLCVAGKR